MQVVSKATYHALYFSGPVPKRARRFISAVVDYPLQEQQRMQSPSAPSPRIMLFCSLFNASAGDGWWRVVLDGAGRRSASLDGLNNALGLEVVDRDLAEDDVAAIEPGGHDGGDEELGAVAVESC